MTCPYTGASNCPCTILPLGIGLLALVAHNNHITTKIKITLAATTIAGGAYYLLSKNHHHHTDTNSEIVDVEEVGTSGETRDISNNDDDF